MGENVHRVRKENLCVSCGICKGVCPTQAIHYEKQDGLYVPAINEEKCTNCGLCQAVCPGKGFNYSDLYKRMGREIPKDLLCGTCIKALTSMSKSQQILKNATSGGTVTTLVTELLKKGVYDVAFCVSGYCYNDQVESEPFRKNDSFSGVVKSRYIPISQTKAVKYIISNRDQRIIFIGVSCFIQGLTRVISQFGLNRNNYLLLGLFCGKNYNYNIVDYFQRAEKKQIKELYFRSKDAGGWPGDMKIRFQDNTEKTLDKIERIKIKDFYQMERCLYCMDKMNQFADISLGDNYTKKNQLADGTNSVIIRTDIGKRVWNEEKDKFDIWDADFNEIMQSQQMVARKINIKNMILKDSSMLIEKESFLDDTTIILQADKKEYCTKINNLQLGAHNEYNKVKKKLRVRESTTRAFFLKMKYKIHELKEQLVGEKT